MELEKKLRVPAPVEKVWALLLDPSVMAKCVPGTVSVEVLSDVEYVAVVQVKISFVSAKFKIRTRILEQKPPHFIKTEGTGEDTSVGSSLKQTSEIALNEVESGQTELVVKVKVDVFGRLGSFGLNVMKTKADRMWDEFGANLIAKIKANETPTAPHLAEVAGPSALESASGAPSAPTGGPGAVVAAPVQAAAMQVKPASWWRRALRVQDAGTDSIRVEISRGNERVLIHWPAGAAHECGAWLNSYLSR